MQLLNVLGESKTSGLSVWDIFFLYLCKCFVFLFVFFHYRHALYLLIYKMVK